MASFNKVILVGNLTRDPGETHTSVELPLLKSVAWLSRTWFDQRTNEITLSQATFVDVTTRSAG